MPVKIWVDKLVLVLNMVAAALLCVAGLAAYISPALAWQVALIGIAFSYILIGNLLFVLYWLFRRKAWLLISLAVILINFSQLRYQVQFNLGKAPALNPEKSFRLLTFNTRLFDLYRWSGQPETKDRIFNFLKEADADILCIQEFYTSSQRKGLNNLDSLQQLLKNPRVHVAYTNTRYGTDHWGIATFSRFPIVKRGNILFNEKTNNLCIFSDIRFQGDTIRVYNVHFQSNRFRKEDYEFLGQPNAHENKWVATKSILRRLKTGSVKRSNQVDVVASHIRNSPHPVVICGDFNDPPSSYTYNKIGNNLKDAFVESGNGFGNTYNGRIPWLRIDYIFHDQSLQSRGFETNEINLSDHYPITCTLTMP